MCTRPAANVAMTVAFTCAGRVRQPGRARPAARQLRRLRGGGARPVVGAAPARVAAHTAGGPARDAALRAADGPGGRERVCAAGRRSLLPVSGSSQQRAAGQYAIAIKLATVVFVAVRGFQYAWPPLAYSIDSDEEAARLYSLVTTYYALATGVVVCAVELLGRWIVRLLAAHAVLRRLPRAAVAGAGVGAVRPVPGVRRDRRTRACHLAQLPRGRRRSGGQRRAADPARAGQRRRPGHRRRRHRAVRRLPGDARRHVRAHAQPVQRRLRMGCAWRS